MRGMVVIVMMVIMFVCIRIWTCSRTRSLSAVIFCVVMDANVVVFDRRSGWRSRNVSGETPANSPSDIVDHIDSPTKRHGALETASKNAFSTMANPYG